MPHRSLRRDGYHSGRVSRAGRRGDRLPFPPECRPDPPAGGVDRLPADPQPAGWCANRERAPESAEPARGGLPRSERGEPPRHGQYALAAGNTADPARSRIRAGGGSLLQRTASAGLVVSVVVGTPDGAARTLGATGPLGRGTASVLPRRRPGTLGILDRRYRG